MHKEVNFFKIKTISVYNIIIIHIFIGIIVLLRNFFFPSIEVLKYEVMLIWLWSIVSCRYLEKSYNTPYLYFLGTYFLFLLSRIFLDIINIYDFSITTGFSNYSYDLYTQKKILMNVFLSLWSIHLGYLIKNRKTKSFKVVGIKNNNLIKIGLIIFIMTLPLFYYDIIQNLQLVLSSGYLALFQDYGNQQSIIIILAKPLNQIGLYLFILGNPSKPKLKGILFLYLTVLFTQIIIGQRGEVLSQILMLIYIISLLYDIKIRLFKIILFMFLLISLAIFIDGLRTYRGVGIDKEIFKYFLIGQGVSIQVLGYSIENEQLLNDYKIINLFAELRSLLTSVIHRLIGTKSEITRNAYNSMVEFGHLGLKISYLINSTKFFNGQGLGTSFIAEIYLIAREYGQVIIGLILGYMIKTLENMTYSSKRGILIYMVFAPSLYFLCRDSLLAFLSNGLIAIFIILILYLFNKNVNKALS